MLISAFGVSVSVHQVIARKTLAIIIWSMNFWNIIKYEELLISKFDMMEQYS